MLRKVGNIEDGLVRRFAKRKINRFAACADGASVQRQRLRDPLIFLDAAIIVRPEADKIAIRTDGVWPHVEPGRVDVRADDAKPLRNGARADCQHGHGLVLLAGKQLCAR